eukprot:s679_g16.t1
MILRTCEALGVQEVWLVPPPPGVKYRATMVRSRHASRGAERFLTLRRFASAEAVAESCRAEGRELWVSYCPPVRHPEAEAALAGKNPEAIPLVARSVPSPLPSLALVLGTEGDGISTTMLDLSTRAVFLPMYGFVQSLNVAVACGMLLQRLFDLCPQARGDLSQAARENLALSARTLRHKKDVAHSDEFDVLDFGLTKQQESAKKRARNALPCFAHTCPLFAYPGRSFFDF